MNNEFIILIILFLVFGLLAFGYNIYQLVKNRGYDYNQFAVILGDNFYPFGIDNGTRYQWKNI